MLLTLPQETLNEIVAHLRDEERALQSLSLAGRRFTEECRQFLFRSIKIDSEEKLLRWFDAIPPGRDGSSRYVRLLDIDLSSRRWPSGQYNRHDSLARISSFPQVEHLRIHGFKFYLFSNRDLKRCFGHFLAVRSISIQPISGSPQRVPYFLELFPLLQTTIITSPQVRGGLRGIGAHPIDFACRGDLVLKIARIDNDLDHGGNIFSSLAWPTTCYRRFGMGLVIVGDFSPLELFLYACGGSLEVIQIIGCIFREYQQHLLLSPH
jgi:hypothetical protein